jgi:hypothetical protein
MPDLIFPEVAPAPSLAPTPVVTVICREPLLAIHEILAISIHDVTNCPGWKNIVRDFYKVTRRIENEGWLRRRADELRHDAWVKAHL